MVGDRQWVITNGSRAVAKVIMQPDPCAFRVYVLTIGPQVSELSGAQSLFVEKKKGQRPFPAAGPAGFFLH